MIVGPIPHASHSRGSGHLANQGARPVTLVLVRRITKVFLVAVVFLAVAAVVVSLEAAVYSAAVVSLAARGC